MKTTQKELDDLKTLSMEELAQIVAFSIRDDLVLHARRILWGTNHNAPIKYTARQNNMSLLQDEEKELQPYEIRKNTIQNLKEDYYNLLAYIKTSKNKQGSSSLFKSVLQAKKELKQIKQQIYNLNQKNANEFYDYMGIA